jgi:hypothetical protein
MGVQPPESGSTQVPVPSHVSPAQHPTPEHELPMSAQHVLFPVWHVSPLGHGHEVCAPHTPFVTVPQNVPPGQVGGVQKHVFVALLHVYPDEQLQVVELPQALVTLPHWLVPQVAVGQ